MNYLKTAMIQASYYYMYAYEHLCGIPSADEILDGVFIGDLVAGNDLEFLLRNNITYVINVSNIIYPRNQVDIINKGIRIKNISVRDLPEDHDILFSHLPELIQIIKEERKNGKILVNCFAGRQRSAAIVACFLYKHVLISDNHHLNEYSMKPWVDNIISFIQAKRSVCFHPQANFYDMIMRYVKETEAKKGEQIKGNTETKLI